ncbi:hypothetical protein FKW77_010381 [Venturia effusa]|uniref:Uncharacterized protein n=1 Tax=Venturia effusa TaxID=50376 RepID=A0A517KXQ8_9PEZI|nr:hypothetical protein FKW77_010381 [Venturia effusa]
MPGSPPTSNCGNLNVYDFCRIGSSGWKWHLTVFRPRGRRDSYTAEDQFCADLDRRLSFIQQWKEQEKSGSPQPWNPYPDSLHSSSLETHMHRLSVARSEGSPELEFSATPPPRLQKRRGWRKLSAEKVYNDVDTLHILTAGDRPYAQNQASTTSKEADWEEDSQAKTLTAHEWPTNQGFFYPQPVAAPYIMNPQIQQAMIRRARARRYMGKPPHTHYKRFDEGAFGERLVDTPSSVARRPSLLSVGLKGDIGQMSDSDEHSQSSTPTATQAKLASPRNGLRRDSGHDTSNNNESENEEEKDVCSDAEKCFQYDFGQQGILF